MGSEYLSRENTTDDERLEVQTKYKDEAANNTQFSQHIILIGIVHLIVNVKNIILLPLLTNNLSINDFGIYDLFITSATVLPLITTLGLSYAIIRFLAANNEKNQERETFYSIFFIILLISSSVGLLLLIFGLIILDSVPGGITIILLGFVIIPDSLLLVNFAFLRAKQLIVYFSFFKTLQMLLIVIFSTLALHFHHRLIGAMLAVFISDFIIFFGAFILILRKIGFQIPKFSQIKEYITFSFPMLISSIAYLLVSSFDRYVIAVLLGTTYVGYYSPAYTLGSVFTIFATPFGILLPTVISKSYDMGNYEEVRMYIKYSLKLYLLITIPSLFGIAILSKEILLILSTEDIAEKSFTFVPYIGIGVALWGIYAISSQILVMTKRTSITGRIWLSAALLNVFITPILISKYYLLGAAISVVITFGFIAFNSMIFSLKIFKFSIDLHFLVKSIMASVLMSLMIISFHPEGFYQLIIASCSGALLYLLLMVLVKGITKDELLVLRNSLTFLRK